MHREKTNSEVNLCVDFQLYGQTKVVNHRRRP